MYNCTSRIWDVICGEYPQYTGPKWTLHIHYGWIFDRFCLCVASVCISSCINSPLHRMIVDHKTIQNVPPTILCEIFWYWAEMISASRHPITRGHSLSWWQLTDSAHWLPSAGLEVKTINLWGITLLQRVGVYEICCPCSQVEVNGTRTAALRLLRVQRRSHSCDCFHTKAVLSHVNSPRGQKPLQENSRAVYVEHQQTHTNVQRVFGCNVWPSHGFKCSRTCLATFLNS